MRMTPMDASEAIVTLESLKEEKKDNEQIVEALNLAIKYMKCHIEMEKDIRKYRTIEGEYCIKALLDWGLWS